mgnify:CR=1 FL=1
MGDLLTPVQAAELLGITTTHLRYLHVHGRIRARVTPLGRLYRPEEAERVRTLRASKPARGRPSLGRRAAAVV